MKLPLIILSLLFLFTGYTHTSAPVGDDIKVSTNEGKNSLVFRCSYPAKYYQKILKDVQEFDPEFTPMEKTYALGNGSAVIKFKSKGKLIISYQADDKEFADEKEKLKDLALRIGITLE